MTTTPEFKLRPIVPSDAESIAKYGNNIKIAQNMRNVFPHPYGLQDAVNFIANIDSGSVAKLFAIDIDGEAIGATGIFPQTDIHEKNAEIGYWLGEPFWGKGIATAVVKQMIDFGFKTFDITRIYAIPFSRNVASQRVLEKAGMQLEARLAKAIYKYGEVMDELIYSVRRE